MVSKVLSNYQTGDTSAVLSPTFQSSQLHTPRHLSRITIDDNKYKGYRVGSLGSLSDRHRIATKLDDSIWGRRHGYGGIGTKPSTVPEPVLIGAEFPRSHKHFTSGIHPHPRTYSIQPLYKTSLDLGSERIKELQSRFPAEHPFYSHTPRFSLFPGIQHSSLESGHNRPNSAGCSESLIRSLSSARPPSGNPSYSQAGASVYPDTGVRAPPPVVVSKTKGQGLRQEICGSRRIRSAAETWELDDVINRGEGNLVWDVPRSARQRVVTYPSPRLIFEGSREWSRHGSGLVSARTSHVLENLQRSYLQTTYQRQYTGTGPQGEAKLDDYIPGYRPYSAERGSAVSERTRLPSGYYRAIPWEGRHSASAAHLLRLSTHSEVHGDPQGSEGSEGSDGESSSEEDTADKPSSSRRVSFRHRALHPSPSVPEPPEVTEHVYDPDEPPIDTDRSGTVVSVTNSPMSLKSSLKRVHISERPSSAPSSADLTPRSPRTLTSSKRLMEAYTFNKSEIRKQFHYNFPEVSPDLRELARYPSAKRHNIHGIHSYYFH